MADTTIDGTFVNFLEDYVLATDRLKVVEELYDSDTLDYWYWSLLNVHTRGKAKEVNSWFDKAAGTEFLKTEKLQDLFFRQNLEEYGKENWKNVSTRLLEICDDVCVEHFQDKEVVDVKTTSFPTQLQLITRELLQKTYKRMNEEGGMISDLFTARAAPFLAKQKLDSDLCKDFLELIESENPDMDGLLNLIISDLDQVEFGTRKIHEKLTKRHMMKIAEKIPGDKKVPGILNDEAFLITFCRKLRPITDTNLKENSALMGQYLEDLVKFALNQIGDNHASLKALILFNYMRYHEAQGGEPKKGILKQYMAIPKFENIYKPENSVRKDDPAEACDFEWCRDELPELEPIVNDEPLVRRSIAHFFLAGDKTDAWVQYADKMNYSLPLWAESMLLVKRGNEQFQNAQINQFNKSDPNPGAYKRLEARVELDFSPTNQNYYAVEDEVVLEFVTKNNPTIDVSVYDVNARNYYNEKLMEIPLNLNLSGSAAIAEITRNFDHEPIRRVTEKLPLDCLKGRRGVFLIDMIGNGVTTRALIRKGELRFICDQVSDSTGGYVFKVFNEKNEMIKNPSIWMLGKEYASEENGDIYIPFSEKETNPRQLIVLEDKDTKGSATLRSFCREVPDYRLECGMYIDREQLLRKKQARVIIRANLYMNSNIISISNLNDVNFKLTLEDNAGNVKTRIEEIQLHDDKESVFTFTVPTELRMVECVLTCKAGDRDMISKQVVHVNSNDDTTKHANIYMYPSGMAGYVLAVLGKNGEGYANVPIKLSFKHNYFREPLEYTVQTDDNGHVYLGSLRDVETIDATCDEPFVSSEATFETLVNLVNVPSVIHRSAGTSVKLPFTPQSEDKDPLIHLYDADYIQSFSKQAKYENGYISCDGLPPGNYILYIRDYQSLTIEIRISEGFEVANDRGLYVLSNNRVLELSEDTPLQITEAKGNRKEGFTVKLCGFNELTRVHVVCCGQNPVFNMYGFLASPFCPPNQEKFNSPASMYTDAHPLDSEYKYIVDRKHANKHVGNFLQRPGVLMNPWTSQGMPTRTSAPREAKTKFGDEDTLAMSGSQAMVDVGSAQKRREADPAPLEFLGDASFVYANRLVGEDGTLTIASDLVSPNHNLIQILAVDDDNTCLKNVILEEPDENAEVGSNDVRLGDALQYDRHFTEVRRVICLPNAKDDYTIKDFSTAEYEPYETLEEPFNLYRSLAGSENQDDGDTFYQFEPLILWHDMSMREKLNFYDKFSCNEVNLFIKRRDPDFFKVVIVPALENKVQKTFFDKYLLEQNLEDYVVAHKFQKLNALEQIFLADNLGEDTWIEKTLRYFAERAEMVPVDPRKEDETFDLAINSRQLGVEELDKAQQLLEAKIAEDLMASQSGREGASIKTVEYADYSGQEKYISQTCEYQDTGYFRVPVTAQSKDMIKHTRFWNDFAQFMLNPKAKTDGFLSKWFMTPCSSINEMLCALAVLDVPLEADEPKRLYGQTTETGTMPVRVLAKDPVILFVRELVETQVRTSAINVSTNYFDPLERMHVVDGEKVDKFIYGKFRTNKVYGSRLVVTNVSSVDQRVEILCQIPQGAIPCGAACFQTKNWTQVVQAFGTYKREFYFYWPEPGQFVHFPVHVNKNGETIGYAKEDPELKVESGVIETDKESWKYVANIADEEAVLAFLAGSDKLQTVDLSKICWRLKDNDKFFFAVCDILRKRCVYNEAVWAYSLVLDKGRCRREIGEFLTQNEAFRREMQPALSTKMVKLDPAATLDNQIREYFPMMNPRAHDIAVSGSNFLSFYTDYLKQVAFSSATVEGIPLADKLCLCNYLLLRNLGHKAQALFDTIKEKKNDFQMVYDYMATYLAFNGGSPDKMAKLAQKYASATLPVSMKKKWEDALVQLQHRTDPSLSDVMFLKKQEEARLKALEPFLDFFPQDDHSIRIEHRNVPYITVNFYRTELELMFSMYPFQDENVSYKLMLPNMSEMLELEEDGEIHSGETVIELPDILRGENTIVEMISHTDKGELKVTKVAYDNELDVTVSQEIGQLRVLHSEKKTPIDRAYVKVYAQNLKDGSHTFFKDGYTDIRGRFDYRTLSTDQLRSSKRLSIYVSSADFGAVIKEVNVPQALLTRSNLFVSGPSFRLGDSSLPRDDSSKFLESLDN